MFLPGLNWQNIFKKEKYCKKNSDCNFEYLNFLSVGFRRSDKLC
ncbi:hypothetical protein LEP1GSC059_4270 [Leptospira noguchii serovar Panama str. CZ214]|uniref:Uncharacterized protein n=1 Tax=Leptospira noguchii serovar Panama str. CZ214 TaxID=1001595 RepID=T0FRP7_9LEPT|nr:hypothetical protein LEP1GSC059_4270 [Leptospira noguchii serovar Panama str. CZ214]